MFKKILFQLHWFLGITAGLILSLMGVTGAIYSYDQPILKWMNQESYVVQAETQPKLTPAEIYQHFQKTKPEFQINSITVDQSPTAASNINIVKEGERRGFTMMINPYSAELLPEIKGREFFMFIQQLHRNLTVGEVGKQITGICTLILIFFVLSGLYLRWPKRHTIRQWLAFKPQLKGRNFLWDLHAVAGTWVLVFYLILACTGLTWSYSWWKDGMYKVLGVEPPASNMQAQAKPSDRAKAPSNTDKKSNKAHNNDENKGLDPAAISYALTQTWTGFNKQINRPYSALTLTLPKKPDGVMELMFLDPVPQHERARNRANYNYQTQKIEKLDIYEDKKLNEKIMSSLLPVHRGSFFGPVYQFLVVIASLAMPLFFISGWLLYVKRRKQKKLTQAAKIRGAHVEPDPNAVPWLVVYATQTGVSEQLAWRTATALQQARQPTSVMALQQISDKDLAQNTQILFIVSTYGTGEAPDLAASFEKKWMSKDLDLHHLKYAVLALGSKEYPDSYCAFGHRLDEWLGKQQAQKMFDVIEVNNGNDEAINLWNLQLSAVSNLELQEMNIDKVFDQWTLNYRSLLNPNSQGAPAYNIQLSCQHDMTWQAGDIAEIQPGNSSKRIQIFLDQHQLLGSTHVNGLNMSLEQALWDKDLTQEIKPFKDVDDLVIQLATLATREYSIASIPSQQTLRLVIRQKYDEQGHLGLGSGWLTEHCQINEKVSLRIRNNPSFHLITDNRPIILIGNGTGIAGLMSLMSARVRSGYTENWLIFGERHFEHDFFFKETIQAWQNTSMLKRLDLAFSRDQAEKIYVHHKLREHTKELQSWIAQGAVIYVCGSIQGMASDVDQALIDILGETLVDELRQQERYRRDVY